MALLDIVQYVVIVQVLRNGQAIIAPMGTLPPNVLAVVHFKFSYPHNFPDSPIPIWQIMNANYSSQI